MFRQVTTIAGDGTTGHLDGPALSAQFDEPHGLAVASTGRIYVSDSNNHAIRVIENGQVRTLAGDGAPGFADGPEGNARFNFPLGIALDAEGALYVADQSNHRIRKIHGGEVKTFAGDGTAGFADGPVSFAQFNKPHTVSVDVSGAVYVADNGNKRIRMIAGGEVTTLAGTGVAGYVDGAAGSAQLTSAIAVEHAPGGKVYFAEYNKGRVRVIENGVVSTLVGSGDTTGFVDGKLAVARFGDPHDITVGSGGQLYVADQTNSSVRMIAGGEVVTLAGNGTKGYVDGPVHSARFENPVGVAVDTATGSLYVADGNNHRIRKMTP
jgi:DNA-binding beta-propeller fold protein YncE